MPSQEQAESTIEAQSKVWWLFINAGMGLSYLVVVIGYIITILNSAHLTLFNFLLFTALNVGYCAILWWVGKMSSSQVEGTIGVGLLALLTVGVGALPLIGLQWDWLLYLVTLSLFFFILP